MTAALFNQLYGAVISPAARVSIPHAWLPVVQTAMQEIHDLPTDVRAYLIVMGIVDEGGELVFEVMACTPFISDDGMRRLKSIISTAQAGVRKLQGSVH